MMRERTLLYVLCFIFLLASLAPTVYELIHQDRIRSERSFELVHNFPTDYNFYLSRIRQGIEGRTTVIEQYTSEPHEGSFIHVLYLALGWLGRWNRVPWERGGDVYHVARIVFGGLLLVMIAEFCKKAFESGSLNQESGKKNTSTLLSMIHDSKFMILAFLLAVTASTWPKVVFYGGGWRFGGYMPWWSVMDSLQRITFIPHLLLGQALILFLIMALSDRDTMRNPGNWVFLGVLAFLEGIIFPPGFLFVIVSVGVLSVLEMLYEIKGINLIAAASKIIPMQFIPRAIVLGLGLPSLVYLSLMTSFYPWKRLAEFDIVKPLPFQYGEYLLAVGPILPIGIIGLILAIAFRERRILSSVAWVLAWVLLLFVFQFIPSQSPLRFSEMIPHVPLAILAAYLFYRLCRSRFILVIPAALIILGFGVMYSSWLWQRDFVDHKMRASYPLVPTGSYVMYPLTDFIAAMKFIQDHTTRDTVILSETTAGNYLPVYSGNTIYVGHDNTVDAEAKQRLVREFFSGRMSREHAQKWLQITNLRVVFFGPQEKEDGGVSDLAKVYPFLSPTYQNKFVTVYEVK